MRTAFVVGMSTLIVLLATGSVSISAPPSNPDPVASLKAILKRLSSDGTAPRVTDFGKPGRWFKRQYLAKGIKFDVRKTDSLVSPFVAEVNWAIEVYHTSDYATRSGASGAAIPRSPSFGAKDPDWWAKLAFQDGKWIIKDLGWDIGDDYRDELMHQRYSRLRDVRNPLLDWWLAFGGQPPDQLAEKERIASEGEAAINKEREVGERGGVMVPAATPPQPIPGSAGLRRWTRKDGSLVATARFLSLKSGKVTLTTKPAGLMPIPSQRADEGIVTIRLPELCESDRKFAVAEQKRIDAEKRKAQAAKRKRRGN